MLIVIGTSPALYEGMTYAFHAHGQTFTPDGPASIPDVSAHNTAVTATELSAWATQPARFCGYVTLDQSIASRPARYQTVRLTTWTGELLGTGAVTGVFRNNMTGSRTVAILIMGTNGATYHGRFGDERSQLCRVTKSR